MSENFFGIDNHNYFDYSISNEFQKQLDYEYENESFLNESNNIKSNPGVKILTTIKIRIHPIFDYEDFKKLFDVNLPGLYNKIRSRSLNLCKEAKRDYESIIREIERIKRENESLVKENEELKKNNKIMFQKIKDLRRTIEEKEKQLNEVINIFIQEEQKIKERNDRNDNKIDMSPLNNLTSYINSKNISTKLLNIKEANILNEKENLIPSVQSNISVINNLSEIQKKKNELNQNINNGESFKDYAYENINEKGKKIRENNCNQK